VSPLVRVNRDQRVGGHVSYCTVVVIRFETSATLLHSYGRPYSSKIETVHTIVLADDRAPINNHFMPHDSQQQ